MKKKKFLKRLGSIVLTAAFLIYAIPASGAISWIERNDGLSSHQPQTISVDTANPRFVYLGARGLILKSTDEGLSWRVVFKIPQAGANVNAIKILPADPRTILAGCDSGLFVSSDYGKHWQKAYSGASDNGNVILSFLSDATDPDTVYAGTGNGLIVSNDKGVTWRKKAGQLSGRAIRSISRHPEETKKLLFVTDTALFSSADNGRTVSRMFSFPSLVTDSEDDDDIEEDEEAEPSGKLRYVIITGTSPYTIYLATTQGIYSSKDNGATWNLMVNPEVMHCDVRNLAYGAGFLFAATDRGVFRLSEIQGQWQELYSGLTSNDIRFLELAPSGTDLLWAATPKGVYLTKGDIFEPIKDDIDHSAYEILNNFTDEPSCFEVQQAAIRYAEVHPEKIERWRRGASAKPFLPKLTVGVDHDTSDGLHWDSGANPDRWVIGPEDESTGWDITATWDLSDLIWNNDHTTIDIRSKLMVQLRNDIVNEVTRIYFERRKLQANLLNAPPADDGDFIEKELRLQELTADIDGMTGGWFSMEIIQRRGQLHSKK